MLGYASFVSVLFGARCDGHDTFIAAASASGRKRRRRAERRVFFLIVPMVAKLSINPYNGIGILSAGAKKIS
jgi:hypothetical protein